MTISSTARVVAVCVSQGGIPRVPAESLILTDQGIAGDEHRYEAHYAENRGVSLFDQESIERMTQADWPLGPGCVGENITLEGIDIGGMEVGQILELGTVRLELSRLWIPCHAASHTTGESRINTEKLPGYFAKILRPGTLEPGCLVRLGEGQ
ncbi:MAG: MOSC domain-containing protein [Pirellulaceae bacterium]